jgi:hypothetical protein
MPQLPPSSDFGATRRVLVSTQKPEIAHRQSNQRMRLTEHVWFEMAVYSAFTAH